MDYISRFAVLQIMRLHEIDGVLSELREPWRVNFSRKVFVSNDCKAARISLAVISIVLDILGKANSSHTYRFNALQQHDSINRVQSKNKSYVTPDAPGRLLDHR